MTVVCDKSAVRAVLLEEELRHLFVSLPLGQRELDAEALTNVLEYVALCRQLLVLSLSHHVRNTPTAERTDWQFDH